MSYAILIVDDSLPMRSVIKRTLKAAGYENSEIFEAQNGKEGLELLDENWVDLILTDYNMPVMNGLDFLISIKANELTNKIPVVIISTEGHETKIKTFMESGAAGYITKPFTPEAIRDLIVELLGDLDYEEDIDDDDTDFDF